MGLAQSLRAVVDQFGGAQDDYYDDYYDDDALAGSAGSDSGGEAFGYSPPARERGVRPLAVVRPPRLEFALITPHDFDAAQQIADRLRAGGPVIVDLQSCGRELTMRLTDFCSGLTYALEGDLQCIGETVVLLVPHGAELSSDAPGSLRESRFLNQV